MKVFQVDAFTNEAFKGNPAAVCIMDEWMDDSYLQKVAIENNLAETAFCVKEGEVFHIRWFTPEYEIDLCGHATLATAHVLYTEFGYYKDAIEFHSKSGRLVVSKQKQLYKLNFPSRPAQKAEAPEAILKSLSIQPKEILKARDYILVYESEDDIRNMKVNRELMNTLNIDPGCVVITAPGKQVDFVSRVFTPQASVFEDPVTGSTHCSLVPYWSERLQKLSLNAQQLSERGGNLYCENAKDRVFIEGEAITVFRGEWLVPVLEKEVG